MDGYDDPEAKASFRLQRAVSALVDPNGVLGCPLEECREFSDALFEFMRASVAQAEADRRNGGSDD